MIAAEKYRYQLYLLLLLVFLEPNADCYLQDTIPNVNYYENNKNYRHYQPNTSLDRLSLADAPDNVHDVSILLCEAKCPIQTLYVRYMSLRCIL